MWMMLLFLFMTGLFTLTTAEENRHISDMAEIDVAILTDEAPLDRYLDGGFNAYLQKMDFSQRVRSDTIN